MRTLKPFAISVLAALTVFGLARPAAAATAQRLQVGSIDRSARPVEQRPAPTPRQVISPDLAKLMATSASNDTAKVIVELAAPRLTATVREIRSSRAEVFGSLRRQARTVMVHSRSHLPEGAEHDRSVGLGLTGDDRVKLDAVNAEWERQSLAQRQELSVALTELVAPILSAGTLLVEGFGGRVYGRLQSLPLLFATIPVGRIAELAAHPAVLGLSPVSRDASQLDIAADAILIDTGPWVDDIDGGLFDPAVLDSGTILDHPGLDDGTSRSNFYSWYLVDGAADLRFDDATDENDRNGHGIHVLGIVASEGSTTWPDHLGMAYGVAKTVTLKAGFHATDGRSYMYSTDAMTLVDSALTVPAQLFPLDSFNDDIDAINVSYGGVPSTDETSYSRFWDALTATFADTLVTIAAGNEGPAVTVHTPSVAYNVISVANVDDRDTESRIDDVIASSSSRGPTVDGRRKPDLAAPGTDIFSANNYWFDQATYIEHSGTSMAAPMVLGAAMTLMDAGVTDDVAIKAVLINHARKSDTAIDFDDDADGWDPAYGWGYINLNQSYYHAGDVFVDTLNESGQDGDLKMYLGSMGGNSVEGRDRVTLVWNREAVYTPADYPATAYDLVNLNLVLYNANNLTVIDTDATSIDNVHQVRQDAGTTGDVVVKVYTRDTDFAHGGDTQEFALATEEDFAEVPYPADFTLGRTAPYEVKKGQEFQIDVSLTNTSVLTTLNNMLILNLPPGWTLVSGGTTVAATGPMGTGDTGIIHSWTFTADAAGTLEINHLHSSYGELWGETYGITVQLDPEIFDDGFESGGTSAWSSVAP